MADLFVSVIHVVSPHQIVVEVVFVRLPLLFDVQSRMAIGNFRCQRNKPVAVDGHVFLLLCVLVKNSLL
ncbi:hypothetical protein COU77_03930 [Candidatus Peregrinibacteria bacterium CG10_big_fil_rev_8_21_14_0_10_49_16]|nr:MAG: hypothetical protein COU77_03930 [Candidatus Peregrinibacteria bacterium CG10_big_fil_rev_8_21_14_0_10_49_16]